MKRFWIKKGLMVGLMAIAVILVFGTIVMALWNAIFSAVLGVKAITFLQAPSILLLSKILFGGFRGGSGPGGGRKWKQQMKAKWETMTPNERDNFKLEWRSRCGSRWGMKVAYENQEKNAL